MCAPAGAEVFAFHDARALEEAYLAPQPRAALHGALVHPSRYLPAADGGEMVIDE